MLSQESILAYEERVAKLIADRDEARAAAETRRAEVNAKDEELQRVRTGLQAAKEYSNSFTEVLRTAQAALSQKESEKNRALSLLRGEQARSLALAEERDAARQENSDYERLLRRQAAGMQQLRVEMSEAMAEGQCREQPGSAREPQRAVEGLPRAAGPAGQARRPCERFWKAWGHLRHLLVWVMLQGAINWLSQQEHTAPLASAGAPGPLEPLGLRLEFPPTLPVPTDAAPVADSAPEATHAWVQGDGLEPAGQADGLGQAEPLRENFSEDPWLDVGMPEPAPEGQLRVWDRRLLIGGALALMKLVLRVRLW